MVPRKNIIENVRKCKCKIVKKKKSATGVISDRKNEKT